MVDKRKPNLKQLLEKGGIPALSPLALRLVELATDDRAEANDLVEVIEKDPGLTTRLLSMVNSPHYRGGRSEVTAVSRAVVLMGFEEIRFMALSMTLKDTLPVSTLGPDYHLFWRTSVHRAVLARQTAQTLAMDNHEEAFTAGLVQEMGLPMLLTALSQKQREGFPGFHVSCEDQIAWEEAALGFNHRELGKMALAKWNLPAGLVACQEMAPQDAVEGFPPLALLADFARRAAESFFAPGTELTDVHRIGKDRFGLADDQVNGLLTGSLIDAGEIADAMDVDLDFHGDVSRVLANATLALERLKTTLRERVRQIASKDKQEKTEARALLREDLSSVSGPLKSVGGLVKKLAARLENDGGLAGPMAEAMGEVERLERVLADIEVLKKRR